MYIYLFYFLYFKFFIYLFIYLFLFLYIILLCTYFLSMVHLCIYFLCMFVRVYLFCIFIWYQYLKRFQARSFCFFHHHYFSFISIRFFCMSSVFGPLFRPRGLGALRSSSLFPFWERGCAACC